MIAKRIRKEERQLQRGGDRLAMGLFALSKYLVDARPWAEPQRGVTALSRYALHAADFGYEPGEKVEAFDTFNLIGDSLADWQMQMLSVAARGRGMRDPVEHIVISWREGEEPSAAQVEEAVSMVLKTCGYDLCPAIWSYHTNTPKLHAHIALVRVDPVSGKAQGDRWDIDRLHQALALIEEKQGWSSELNALYVARGGAVYDRETDQLVWDTEGKRVGARGKGGRLPLGINEVALELAGRVERSTSWPELHQGLDELGAFYRRKGSGGVVRRAGGECKASRLGRACGLKELEKRLGHFEPATSALGYQNYMDRCRQELNRIRGLRDREQAHLKAWLDSAIASVGGGNAVLVQAIRAEYQAALTALNSAFASAIDGFAKSRLAEDAWSAGGSPAAPPAVSLPSLILPVGATFAEAPAARPEGLTPRRTGWRTGYFAADGSRAFDDLGFVILVYQTKAESIDTALRLGASRWGTVRVFGSTAFVEKCLDRAVALGIDALDSNGQRRTSAVPPPEIRRPENRGLNQRSKAVEKPEPPRERGLSASSGVDVEAELAELEALRDWRDNGRSR